MNKGLEALETLFKDIEHCSIDLARADLDEYKLIEEELKEKEELEKLLTHERELNNHLITHEGKALEIIKETFKITFDDEEQTITIDDCYSVTFHNKEKYDLLKEVLYEKET